MKRTKSIFKLFSLVISMVLVFAFAFTLTACVAEKEPDPKPQPEHTHTYADTWSKDETNHWHAATCEHKTEIKDKAAHTFSGDKCTVCGFEKEPEPAVVKCNCDPKCIVCPDCGGCIDTDCKKADCIKCGDKLTSHLFEAENCEMIDSTDKADAHFNITDKNIAETEEQVTYVQGCMGNTGGKLIFKINSDKACTATLRVRNAKNFVKTIFTEFVMVTVNDDMIERDSYVNEPDAGLHRKRDFDWTNLGCVQLKAGENIIIFEMISIDDERGYNFDKIDVMTEAGVNLTWNPLDNADRISN